MKSIQSKNITPNHSTHSPFFGKGSSDYFQRNSNTPFFNASHLQTKLTVNDPNDPFEKEADSMADKVVQRLRDKSFSASENNSSHFFNKHSSFVQRKCATCDEKEKLQKKEENEEKDLLKNKLQTKPIFESNVQPPCDEKNIQRKCADCEREEKLQKKSDSNQTVSSNIERSLNSSKGSGSSLPTATREQMENSFGADFSNVRIHNDNSAVQMNKDLNAQAFTHGNDIYFNSGKYDSDSTSGTNLLVHELTHVIQQGHSSILPNIQKLGDSDFRITGLDPDLAAANNVIRFEAGKSVIPAVEIPKINTQATPVGRDITLNGYSSEEGSVSVNTALVTDRIKNVSSRLKSRGHKGPRHHNPNPTGQEGNKNYRGTRIVEIVNTPVLGNPIPTIVSSCTTVSTPCITTFSTAAPLAIAKVISAMTALILPNAATLSQLTTFFGGNSRTTIIGNLGALLGELTSLNAVHNDATDCHLDDCDGTCGQGAGAYVDRSVAPPKMILCGSFLREPAVNSRADTFIHESLHATPGVLTDDIAYAHTRRIRTLSDAEKLKNTDSYVNLISILHNPGASISVPPVDTISGPVTGPESAFGQNAIDFMEQWLIACKFNMGSLYEQINKALLTPATWKTATVQWFHHNMNQLSPLFGLTDPGLTPPFTVPLKSDKIRVAGIGDRFLRMRNVLYGQTITLTKITSGPEQWSPPALTVIGNSTKVNPAFFTKTPTEAIKHLLELMLKSMPDVPPALVTPYVEAADKIRMLNGVGP